MSVSDKAGSRPPHVAVKSVTARAASNVSKGLVALSLAITSLATGSALTTGSALLVAGGALVGGPGSVARAQENESFVLNRFRPAPTTEDGFSLQNPETLGHLRWSASVYLDYAHSPLVVRRSDGGDEVGKVVNHALGANFLAALGLWSRGEIYLSVPMVLYQSGDDGVVGPAGAIGDVSSFGVAQPIIGGSVRALGSNELADEEFKLGFAASLVMPFGSEGALASDDGVAFRASALMSRPFLDGKLIPVANLGAGFRPARNFQGARPGSEIMYGAGLHSLLVDQALRVMLEVNGVTGLRSGQFFSSASSPVEVLGGARYTFPIGVAIGGGASMGLTEAVGDPNFRILFNLGYASPRKSGEGRKLKKRPGDRDGDGILDKDDACPDDPEDFDDFEDDDGCPDLDNDQDGIPDVQDACPNRAETRNGYQDDDGCPDRLPNVLIEEGEVVLPEPIKFELNKAVLLPESTPILTKVAVVMKEHPDIQLLAVEGHASDEGTEEYNLILSRQRATVVVQWLADHGVEKWRLSSRGYGKTRPLYPNDTEAHRQFNRRVEFVILERSINPEVRKQPFVPGGGGVSGGASAEVGVEASMDADVEVGAGAAGNVGASSDAEASGSAKGTEAGK